MQQTITPAPATQETVAAPTQRLPHFPVTFFAVVMGLAGTSLGWTRASQILGAPAVIGQALLWFALITFLAITGTYAFKAIRHTDAVRGSWRTLSGSRSFPRRRSPSCCSPRRAWNPLPRCR